jgi:hypothetical protein
LSCFTRAKVTSSKITNRENAKDAKNDPLEVYKIPNVELTKQLRKKIEPKSGRRTDNNGTFRNRSRIRASKYAAGCCDLSGGVTVNLWTNKARNIRTMKRTRALTTETTNDRAQLGGISE